MPRGRKKSPSDNVLAQSPEMSAEIAPAPAEKADKTENVSEKAPAPKGRKPRTNKKKAATPVSDNSVKAEKVPETAENKTEKVPAKRGRKPRADKEKTAAMSSADNSVKAETIPETTIEKADKTEKTANKTTAKGIRKTHSDKGTSKTAAKTKAEKGASKRGKKAETKATALAPVEVAEKVSAPDEKKKRTSNKKAKSNKSEEFIIQNSGNEYTMSEITEMCKNAYRGGTRKQIKNIKVYLKAENGGLRAYYVVNEKESGYIDL